MQAINIRQPKRHAKTIREGGLARAGSNQGIAASRYKRARGRICTRQSRRRSVMARAIVDANRRRATTEGFDQSIQGERVATCKAKQSRAKWTRHKAQGKE